MNTLQLLVTALLKAEQAKLTDEYEKECCIGKMLDDVAGTGDAEGYPITEKREMVEYLASWNHAESRDYAPNVADAAVRIWDVIEKFC